MTWGGHERSQDFYKVGDPRLVEASLEIFQAFVDADGSRNDPAGFFKFLGYGFLGFWGMVSWWLKADGC